MSTQPDLRNIWQSTKTQRTMSMTMEAWELLGKMATESATSRSEVLEVLIRSASQQDMDLHQERLTVCGASTLNKLLD